MAKSPAPTGDTILMQECRDEIKKLNQTIFGMNGDGLKVSLVRVEEKLKAAAELSEEKFNTLGKDLTQVLNETRAQTEKLVNLDKKATKIEVSVDAHHKQLHLAELMKKKIFYFIVIGGIIVLFVFASYVPNILNFFLALFGLPPLPIPG